MHHQHCPHPDRVKAILNVNDCTYCELIRKIIALRPGDSP